MRLEIGLLKNTVGTDLGIDKTMVMGIFEPAPVSIYIREVLWFSDIHKAREVRDAITKLIDQVEENL